MLKRLALPFLVAGSVLAATQPIETLRSPDLTQLPKDQFQELLSKALSGPPRSVHIPLHSIAAANSHCSIPLLESKVEPLERFNMPILPTEGWNLDPMRLAPPAPECRNWNQSK